MKDIFVLPEKPAFLDSLTNNGIKVVVVSIIGKSSYSSFGQKVRPLGKVFDFTTEPKSECRIEGSYDDEKQIIYLHLCSLLDSVNLIEHYEALSERCKEQHKNCDFLTVYNEIKSSSAKALLLLFHISHIVILSHPGNSLDFDVNYIQIFKSLDNIRQKCLGQISEVLRTVTGLNSEWIAHGRPCTPRLVFYFEKCPKYFRTNAASANEHELNIKKLEHEIEDRIYHILRKVRIVGNTNCNSLFAIPANQEYVYVNMEGEGNASRLSHAVKQLLRGPIPPPTCPFAVATPPPARALYRFLAVHIDLAFSKGFDDCVGTGRHAHHHTAYFEVPTIEQWFDATIALYKFFISVNDNENNLVLSPNLLGILYTDTKFSEQRCQKVLPLALARYQEGLAAQYTQAHHDTRLALAGSVFAAQARGPLFATFAHDLHAKCEAHWAAGRQLCESPSLTGNPCTLPRNHEPSVPEHHSGVRYVAACDCGRKQGSRDDPYTVKHANWTFYQQLAQECACGKPNTERVIFPVFQPSTDEYRAASAATAAPAASDPEPEPEVEPDLSQTSGLSSLEPAPPHTSPEHETVLQLVAEDDKDKNLVRQPSTTEYLAGMLTSASPTSLLPQFPSWSLVCLGASSLYSHNLGLSDAQHPGFLPATNFLLPWDVTVRLERGVGGWPAVNKCSMGAPRARRARPHHGLAHFVVKIFVGAEYECPRGHRFMLASPDKVLRATAGIVKETGHKITNSDMPLYYNCPCRPNKPLVAQLMRIHVVTPKAPVFVTLNPKVQPAPNAPVFVPRLDGSVRISQSAYWVLRLPYVYATDRETFIANRQTADSIPRLLAGMWGVAESD